MPGFLDSLVQPNRKVFIASVLVLFLGTLVYFTLYIQGIPYEQEEGISRGWAKAASTPWPEMLGHVFRLKTDTTEADGLNLTVVRATESVFHKIITIFFGQSMTAMSIYHILVSSLFIVLAFLFMFTITRHFLISFLTSVYLTFLPAVGWNGMEFGSYSPLDLVMLMLFWFYFSACFKLCHKSAPRVNVMSLALLYGGLWVLAMATIRVKETNLFLVTALSWMMLFLNPAGNLLWAGKFKQGKLALLACVAAVYTIPLFWVSDRTSSFTPVWDCPLQVFMWNKGGWEAEMVPCLFTLERTIPVSVLANLGFFLGWFTVIALGVFIFHKVRAKRKSHQTGADFSYPLLVLGWFVIGIAFFAHYCSVQFIRHQIWAILPFTFLMALLWTHFLGLFKRGPLKIFLALLLFGLAGEKLADNVSHSLFVRQHLEKLWVTKWDFREAVYQDLNPGREFSLFELYTKWQNPSDRLRGLFEFMNAETEKGELLASQEFADYVAKYKTAYIASPKPVTFPEKWQGQLIHEIDINKNSWLTTMKKRKRGVKPYYLYRVEPSPAAELIKKSSAVALAGPNQLFS